MKPNSKLTAKDIATRNNLAVFYKNAISLLLSYKSKDLILIDKKQ